MGLTRIATSIAALPLIVLVVLRAPAPLFAAVLAVVCALALHEFFVIGKVRGMLAAIGITGGAAAIVGMSMGIDVTHVLAATFVIASCYRLFASAEPSGAVRETAPIALGMMYIPILVGYQMRLYALDPRWILFLYGSVWIADATAYYVGKGIGKRKLYPSVSPKKTVAGAVGSVAGGAAGAAGLAYVLFPGMPPLHALAFGLVSGSATIVGDLVESLYKRDGGIKDSGALIPGHGGILDKIDGSLFAGPAMYCLVSLLK
jgi:phosphatidate cytidylyltransferase